jgi:hypothetical protein
MAYRAIDGAIDKEAAMLNWKKFSLKFHTSDRYRYVSIHADDPDDSSGLSHIWFVVEEKELLNRVIADGYHHCHCYGDCWVFFDFEIPRDVFGSQVVEHARMTIPLVWWQKIAKAAPRIWARCRPGYTEEVVATFSIKARENILKQFGQASGKVAVLFYGVEQSRWNDTDPTFTRCRETVTAIARNSTWKQCETAKLTVSRDGDGIYWEAYTPGGTRIMNGGIINHGTETEPDWSVHT